jgi:hypothetical protein
MSETTFDIPLPPAIRRQREAADRLMLQLREARQASDGETPAAAEPAGAAPAEPPAAEPPAAETVPETASTPKPVDWEQRWRTLRGKYDTELPAATQRAARAEQRVQELTEELRQLRERPAMPAPAGANIDPADIENYGEELVNRARAWARHEMAPHISALEQKLERLEQASQQHQTTLQHTTQQSAQDRVVAALDAQVENWRAVNEASGFLAWLDEEEGLSGVSRKDILGRAYTSGNTGRVVQVFKQYLSEQTGHQASAGIAAHTPSRAGGMTLETLAAPGRGSPASPSGAQPEKRIWSQSQIDAFYRDCSAGKYNNRAKEKDRLEADIFAAAAEGRIR